MKVVILCGGYGTRIRDVSEHIPKPMLNIGRRPILWHVMKYYAHWGYNEFILCLGYKGHVIKDYFLNYEANSNDFTITLGTNKSIVYHNEHAESDWKITLAETGVDSMTGARLRRVQKYLAGQESFMLTYGDGVGDIDIGKLVEFHLSHDKAMTVTGVRPPGRFGELMINNSTSMATEFNEKPQTAGGIISGGFFVCRKEIFDYIDGSENVVLEQTPMRKLANSGQMMVHLHEGFWHPMDTNRDYQMLNGLCEAADAPWMVWDK
ncbi:MAG: glucose-1-phosphate cytidylyltransferase [Candidatus Magnetominusculus sp. LBB02]|nr:glucose-1-phosphate cytidylyltransferase [Candidatus Magnetominusculus sp. LBB02]